MAVVVFVTLFRRVHRYYRAGGRAPRVRHPSPRPRATPRAFVIVPVTTISRLTRALAEALSLGHEVVAVTVMFSDGDHAHADELRRQWDTWHPGVPLRVLHTEYTSVVRPIVEFIDAEHATRDEQIVVLIPVVVPTRLRYRVLHNHVEVLLSAALRTRTDVIVARVPMSLDPDAPHPPLDTTPSAGDGDEPESTGPHGVDRARGDR